MSSTCTPTLVGDTMATTDPCNPPNIPRDYRPHCRVEPIPEPDFPHHQYPRWIGHRFTPSGLVLPYPGNTVLAHLSPNSPLHHTLQALYEDVRQQDFASLLIFLPPSSWHMTIYEGITDKIRLRDSYPGDIPLDSSLKVCHAHVAERLAEFENCLWEGEVGQMAVAGFEPLNDGIAFKLEPATSDGGTALRNLRDRLSERLKMRHLKPGDEAKIKNYLTAWLEQLPVRVFELGAPEPCVYDDMYQFRRVFFLE